MGQKKMASFPKKRFSPEARFAPPFFWHPQRLTPTSSRWRNANQSPLTPRSKQLALVRARFMQRRVMPVIFFLAPLSDLAAPLGGVAAEEEQEAVNALDMDCSSRSS
jgi:hypothetical protein